MKMKTDEKNAVEAHILKACGFHSTTPQYKLIQRLFKYNEVLFKDVNYDEAVSLRRDLWLLQFECAMKFDRILITDEIVMKYYENIIGLQSESDESNLKSKL